MPLAVAGFTQRELQFIMKFTEVCYARKHSPWRSAAEALWGQLGAVKECVLHGSQKVHAWQELEGRQFRHLVHALCPSMWGQEVVKAGLLLALLGGVSGLSAPGSHLAPIRGNIHVLLCGDPGLGKSHLLQVHSPHATPNGNNAVCRIASCPPESHTQSVQHHLTWSTS